MVSPLSGFKLLAATHEIRFRGTEVEVSRQSVSPIGHVNLLANSHNVQTARSAAFNTSARDLRQPSLLYFAAPLLSPLLRFAVAVFHFYDDSVRRDRVGA